MSDEVVRFYNDMYAEGKTGKQPSGYLGWLFMRLRRFELHRTPAVFNLLDTGESLLDVGCGNGWLLGLARKEKFNNVYGIEVSPQLTKRALHQSQKIAQTKHSITIKTADLNSRLPFPDNTFDCVTAVSVIEHIFDPYFTVSELVRMLKPNGVIIIEVPNIAWLPRRLDLLLGKLPVTGDEAGWDGGHLHYFNVTSLEKLLKQYGCEIEYQGSTGIFHQMRNIWPSLLGANILIKARKVKNVKKN